MEMQDNEFDELFRSKLDEFEAEPSANVWTGIKHQLNASKRKKILAPFLSIAASIIILVATGILFIPQKEKVSIKPGIQNKTAKVSGVIINSSTVKNHSKSGILKLQAGTLNETAIAVSDNALSHRLKTTKAISIKQFADPDTACKNSNENELVSISQKRQDVISPVVPDETTQLSIKQTTAETTPVITKPLLTTAQLPNPGIQHAIPVKSAHKMRSLGDLINLAVAKVDKRKDKIIEFTDDDDQGATITGINLGIIKIKKGE